MNVQKYFFERSFFYFWTFKNFAMNVQKYFAELSKKFNWKFDIYLIKVWNNFNEGSRIFHRAFKLLLNPLKRNWKSGKKKFKIPICEESKRLWSRAQQQYLPKVQSHRAYQTKGTRNSRSLPRCVENHVKKLHGAIRKVKFPTEPNTMKQTKGAKSERKCFSSCTMSDWEKP